MSITLIALGAVIALLFLLPIIQGVHNSATFAGTLFGAALLAAGLFWAKLGFQAHKYIAFFIIIIFFVTIPPMRWVYRFGRRGAPGGRVMIVLGCRVKGDVPSVALLKRVDNAFYFLLRNPDAVAILSGGQGRDENVSEAECMRALLADRGIPARQLILEDESTSTDENIRNSKAIMDERELGDEAIICTSEYHQYRAHRIGARYGLKCVPDSSRTAFLHLPTFLLRELFAIVNEWRKERTAR